ncbi:hypothetical protein A2U01_0017702, partial [Trifolium medium]|nr:hypothetical protein [Trifolium medium]
MLKFFQDHNVCVQAISETPWNQLDNLLRIDYVQPLGHFGLMLDGGGYPMVDVAAAAAALEAGGIAA